MNCIDENKERIICGYQIDFNNKIWRSCTGNSLVEDFTRIAQVKQTMRAVRVSTGDCEGDSFPSIDDNCDGDQ